MRMNYEFGKVSVKHKGVWYFISGDTEEFKSAVMVHTVSNLGGKPRENIFLIGKDKFNEFANYQNMVSRRDKRCPKVDLKEV